MDRPSWDTYFINIAKLTSERSNCVKRRVGCILVKNKRILSRNVILKIKRKLVLNYKITRVFNLSFHLFQFNKTLKQEF